VTFDEAKRYVPLAVWALVVITVLMIPAKILSYGYLPEDDALRHAAKAVSGKPWQEILVMRSDFAIDPSPGCHVVLGWFHQVSNCGADAVAAILVAGLMLGFNAAALAWLRRPEAWLAVLLAVTVFVPNFVTRLAHGRPYLFTMMAFMTMMLIWTRAERRPLRIPELSATVVLIALAAWIHGSFYLLIMPAGALLLAGRWRQAFTFGACWAAGSFLGCALTGHPWQFLDQSVRHLFSVFGEFTLTRQLVAELLPSDGDFGAVLLVVLVLLWRARSPEWKARELINPLFLMGVLGWLLGFKVVRFWWDWGLPATLLWVAFELQKEFQRLLPGDSWQRVLVTAGLAVGVYFGMTSDQASRWTSNLTTEYITPDKKELAGWLPEPGGIIYSADMRVFNDTFFKNPTAPWRYVLGFESALMPTNDLAVVRNVAWNFGDVRAYDPWVEKMRPEDRLIIRAPRSARPDIPKLEWDYAVTDLWIGRLPRNHTQ
jgi:hypothetical protein